MVSCRPKTNNTGHRGILSEFFIQASCRLPVGSSDLLRLVIRFRQDTSKVYIGRVRSWVVCYASCGAFEKRLYLDAFETDTSLIRAIHIIQHTWICLLCRRYASGSTLISYSIIHIIVIQYYLFSGMGTYVSCTVHTSTGTSFQ